MGLPDLALEPKWHSVSKGQKVSFLGSVVIFDHDHQRHLIRTAIYKKLVVIEGCLPKLPTCTLLDAEITSTEKGIRLRVDSDRVLGHPTMSFDSLYKATDVCSGMGFGGQGLETAGFTIEAVNELRPRLVEFQQKQGVTHIQCGDLGDNNTLIQLHSMCPQSSLIMGGFACQPWSRLGDRGQSNDNRSASLV